MFTYNQTKKPVSKNKFLTRHFAQSPLNAYRTINNCKKSKTPKLEGNITILEFLKTNLKT
jgi:hypothetical protein